jgi:hypothetical protein
MINERNVTYQYIGNAVSGAAATASALPEGAVALVGMDNTVLAGANVATIMKVAQRINGQLVFSPPFVPNNSQIQAINGSANTQQVSFVGWNGTAGQLDAVAQSSYILRMTIKNTQGVYNNTPVVKSIPFYNAAGTQAALALGMLTAFDRIIRREPRQYVRCERVVTGDAQTDVGFTAAVAADRIFVTNGSTNVTFADGADPVADAADGTALAANTVVRIAGVAYRVLPGAAAAGFTLDAPYKGATGMVVGGANAVTQAGIVPNSTNWGLRFTGIELPDAQFDAVNDNPVLVSFELGWNRVEAPAFSPDDTTTISNNVTAPLRGNGTFKEIAKFETYATFNDGKSQISGYPRTIYRNAAAIASAPYTVFTISTGNANYRVATTGQVPTSLYTIRIAIANGLGGAGGGLGAVAEGLATIMGIVIAP